MTRWTRYRRALRALAHTTLILAIAGLTLGPAASPARAAANDGSPLGVNLSNWTYYSSDLVFIDLMKGCSGWSGAYASQSWVSFEPLAKDVFGYPTSLMPDQLAQTLTARNIEGMYPSGRYICLYDGEGEIHFKYAAKVVAREPGRLQVDVNSLTNGGIGIEIRKTTPGNHVRNIRLVHEADMPAYEAGQIFRADFLKRWEKFKVFRFMDWQRTNASQLIRWADRPTLRHSTQAGNFGVSLEHMIDLCNTQHADGWFCIPHQANDDFVRQFATMLRDRMAPDLKIYVEYSNEIWNYGFPQSTYAAQQAIAHGLITGVTENSITARMYWEAYRSRQIFLIFQEVFGSQMSSRVQRVIGAQAAGVHTARYALDYQDTSSYVDVVAIAPYFYPDKSATELRDATVDEIIDSTSRGLLNQTIPWMETYKQEMALRGKRLVCYEGGQHLTARNDDIVWPKFAEANRHSRMGQLYETYLTAWKARGDLCVLYHSAGKYDRYGSWGLLESGNQDLSTAHKYMAADRFIDANRTTSGGSTTTPIKTKGGRGGGKGGGK